MADRPEVDDVGARGEAAFGRLSTALLVGALALLAAVLVALGPHDALERLAVLLRRVLRFWGRWWALDGQLGRRERRGRVSVAA